MRRFRRGRRPRVRRGRFGGRRRRVGRRRIGYRV